MWAGVFPIVVSWWAAVALTAFITAQFLVTSYCRNRKHLKPLWFNSVSNNILWFTFVKVCSQSLLCASAWCKLYIIWGHVLFCGISALFCSVFVQLTTVNLQTGLLLLHILFCVAASRTTHAIGSMCCFMIVLWALCLSMFQQHWSLYVICCSAAEDDLCLHFLCLW